MRNKTYRRYAQVLRRNDACCRSSIGPWGRERLKRTGIVFLLLFAIGFARVPVAQVRAADRVDTWPNRNGYRLIDPTSVVTRRPTLNRFRPPHLRSLRCHLPRHWNLVDPSVAAGDSDGIQRNTRRLICVSLHRGTRSEPQVFLHCGCRRSEILPRKMRGLFPKAPCPACRGG